MSQCCNMCWSSFFGHNDRLFDCQLLLEGIGWQVAQFGVQPHAVVKAHDVVGDVHHGLGVVGVVALPGPFRLEAQEEALHHRVVPAVALAAHAADQAVASQQRLMQRAGVLATPVGVNNQPRCRLALHDGQLQRRAHQLGVHGRRHRPAQENGRSGQCSGHSAHEKSDDR